MKKERIAVIVSILFLISMPMTILSACGTKEPEKADEEEVVALDPEEISSSEGNDPVDEEVGQPADDETVSSLLTLQEAREFLDPLTQWAGLYMIGSAEQWRTYDDTLKRQIAGITIAYGRLPDIAEGSRSASEADGVWMTAPENYLYVYPEEIQAAAEYLFGEPIPTIPGVDDLDNPERMSLNDGEGGMLVRAGDWGTAVPRLEIISIEDMGDSLNKVTASYCLYDYEEGENLRDLGRIIYQIRGGSEPKITNIEIQSYYEDPEAYLLENWERDAVTLEFDDYTIKIPGDWEGRFHTYRDNDSDHFICTAAAGENYTGFLFSIAMMSPGEAEELPSYWMLGHKGNMDIVAIFPTDVDFDPDDAVAAREYINMNKYVDAILSTFEVKE